MNFLFIPYFWLDYNSEKRFKLYKIKFLTFDNWIKIIFLIIFAIIFFGENLIIDWATFESLFVKKSLAFGIGLFCLILQSFPRFKKRKLRPLFSNDYWPFKKIIFLKIDFKKFNNLYIYLIDMSIRWTAD